MSVSKAVRQPDFFPSYSPAVNCPLPTLAKDRGEYTQSEGWVTKLNTVKVYVLNIEISTESHSPLF